MPSGKIGPRNPLPASPPWTQSNQANNTCPTSARHAGGYHPSGILLTVLQISWVGVMHLVSLQCQFLRPPRGTGSVSLHDKKHISKLFKGPFESLPHQTRVSQIVAFPKHSTVFGRSQSPKSLFSTLSFSTFIFLAKGSKQGQLHRHVTCQTGPHTWKGPAPDLMFCCCCLEFNTLTGGPTFSFHFVLGPGNCVAYPGPKTCGTGSQSHFLVNLHTRYGILRTTLTTTLTAKVKTVPS